MWTREWPENPGWYWFYGFQFPSSSKRRLLPVNIVQAADSLAFIAGSAFMYPSEATGVWQPMEVPELPEYGE